MAERIGKFCDDCLANGCETLIGTCSGPIVIMVVGTYDRGFIVDEAELPRCAWQIYGEYDPRKQAIVLRPVPRVELCGCCWHKRLKARGALALITHAQYAKECKKQWEKANPPPKDMEEAS